MASLTKLRRANIEVWDSDLITAKIKRIPPVRDAYESLISAESLLAAPLDKRPRRPRISKADEVANELLAIPRGRSRWKEYERVGARILSDIFLPQLGPPTQQIRSDDDLDIMDAVFPIRASTGPWSLARTEYRSRFVVAEFKNYSDPIPAECVRQIERYLWHSAFRNFGLLVSRESPSEAARAQRRKAWVGPELGGGKLIVFLSDEDLVDMTRKKDQREDPFEVIDSQLEEFFITLSP
jgi:hypothetical protein